MATAVDVSFTAQIKEDFLLCPICHSLFSRPKVLQCQHSFCAKCLKGWLQTRSKTLKSIECAVCRKRTRIPSRGLDDLPENYVLKGMISMLKQRERKKEPRKSDGAATSKTTQPESEQISTPEVGGSASKTAQSKTKSSKKSGGSTSKTGKSKAKSDSSADSGQTISSPEEVAMPGSTATMKPGNVKAKVPPKTKAVTNKRGSNVASRMDKNSNIARHVAKSLISVEMESESSEETISDDSEDDYDSDDSGESFSEFTVSGSSSEDGGDDDYDDSEVPPTPTLKNFGEIEVGMKVYMFNHRGKRFSGIIKLLESCQIKRSKKSRTYAGIEMEREKPSLITADIDKMEDSYLHHWLETHPNPCVVVPAEDCIPAAFVDQLMTSD